jgi:hypothetical protein
MAKLDAYALLRATRPVATRTFEEPETGAKLTLTLRPADAGDGAKATEVYERLVEDYITGSELRAAGPFPDPNVKVSRGLLHTCALIAEMQPEDAPERYDPVELAILSDKIPTAWAGVQQWVRALVAVWNTNRGK